MRVDATRRAVLLSAAAVLAPIAHAKPPAAMASFPLLADITAAIAGASVATLAPDGADPHMFEPRPTDAARLAGAQLFVVAGLGFDDWAGRFARAAGFKGVTVVAGQGLPTRAAAMAHDGHHHTVDPHFWQDPRLVAFAARRIMAGFLAVDPAGAEAYRARADAYVHRLHRLDAEIRSILAAIPQARRVLVTNHDAFGYFADAYGFRTMTAQGVAPQGEPSAASAARLIRDIRQAAVPAVFLERPAGDRLMARIREETGAAPGPRLAADILGPPGSPTGSYIGMMRANAKAIAKALEL
jgi:zinc/manganese transport system substrate-binding protein